jgi:5-formyltetrahydrofolate cyclo-ligase
VNNRISKAELRHLAGNALRQIPVEKRASDSATICELLKQQAFWLNSRSILFFAPLPNEVDVWPLLAEALAAGKTSALPRFDATTQNYAARRVRDLRSEIMTGQFGIREPKPGCAKIPTEKLDLILVPGVAFDLRGNRLGRGKGYYDRLLQKASGSKVGIAFDEQIVEKIAPEAHDKLMDFILTPSRCVKTTK